MKYTLCLGMLLLSLQGVACGLDTDRVEVIVRKEVETWLKLETKDIESQKLLYLLRFGSSDPESCPETFMFYYGFLARIDNQLCEISTRYDQDFVKPDEFKILGVECY